MTSPETIAAQLTFAQSLGVLPYFKQASQTYKIDFPVLLGIASRETGLGTDPYYRRNNFTGRDGHGKGIMQIDDRYHSFAKIVPPNDHQQMIAYGAQFYADLLRQFSGDQKSALAAYNAGPGDVTYALTHGLDPDLFTTGQDYGADVLARAKIIQKLTGSSPMIIKTALPVILVLAGGGILYQQLSNRE